ncbi:MAG: beta-lactamase family protein [Flavobacteriaceae bacterium]|nr:beta-lactamase family protein [Flavobacteriaceae bacterium]
MKKVIFIMGLVLAVACSGTDDGEQVLLPNEIGSTAQLNQYIRELLEGEEIPGLTVGIAKGDAMVYQQGFGYANMEEKRHFDAQTIVNIASVSKTFVGVAAAKAIEQGLFELDTEINSILPVAVVHPKHPKLPIRVRHLLSHTSGIVDNPSSYVSNNYFIAPGENLNSLGAQFLTNNLGVEQMEPIEDATYLAEVLLPDGDLYDTNNFLDAAPGSKWMYSNTATALMAYIIAHNSEMSFAAYVKTYILQPLSMLQSSYNRQELALAEIAIPYMENAVALPIYGNHTYAEGGMYTSNNDLSAYLLEMMHAKQGLPTKIMDGNRFDLLLQPLIDSSMVPSAFADNQMGYWYEKDGHIMHSGNSFGVSSHIQFAADGSSGFFILTNMDGTTHSTNPKWEKIKSLLSQAIHSYLQKL